MQVIDENIKAWPALESEWGQTMLFWRYLYACAPSLTKKWTLIFLDVAPWSMCRAFWGMR